MPEQFVKKFYAWYGKALEAEPRVEPLEAPAILNYVHGSTVERLLRDQDKALMDADYFLNAQDYWPEMFQQMAVSKAVPVTKDVRILSVTLESNVNSAPHLVVFVRQTPAGWRIIKVESVFSYIDR